MTNAQQPSQQLPAQIASDRPSETSRPIPLSWVEKIFGKMVTTYGVKFADAWRGCDMEAVKADWAEALGEYSVAELRAGIEGLNTDNSASIRAAGNTVQADPRGFIVAAQQVGAGGGAHRVGRVVRGVGS